MWERAPFETIVASFKNSPRCIILSWASGAQLLSQPCCKSHNNTMGMSASSSPLAQNLKPRFQVSLEAWVVKDMLHQRTMLTRSC